MTFDQRHLVDVIAMAARLRGGRALLVGGYVRDSIMGRESKDVDIEVFGVAPDALKEMLEQVSGGHVDCVGASFGVYKIGDVDVSIPRRDSKQRAGHKGFVVVGDPTMSIEDAARRRDFTVNAISIDPLTGETFDPFGGIDDVRLKVLRVVDPVLFADDSLRVLRAVQFAARFGFAIEPDSALLMSTMDLSDLPAERVWGEFEKLLLADRPSLGLAWMRALGVLKLFPELAALVDVPQDPEWHPEGDVWTHTLQVVDEARQACADFDLTRTERLTVMLAALCHDLGKATTTKFDDGRWRAHGHAGAGVPLTFELLTRLNVHSIDGFDVRKEVLALVDYHLLPHEWHRVIRAGDKIPASSFRRLSRKVSLKLLAVVAQADSDGRHPKPIDRSGTDWFIDTFEALDLTDGPPPSLLMGRHLIELGVQPGPHVGVILKAVYERQLDGEVTTVDEAIALAKGML
jgi:tRNA nucleotidyltransferase (CCA-adding enzyme)